MAIYHAHAGFITRTHGKGCVASAAYISGEKLHDVVSESRGIIVEKGVSIAPPFLPLKGLQVGSNPLKLYGMKSRTTKIDLSIKGFLETIRIP